MTAPNAQRAASDPSVSAFVTANAGSGKTSTLVSRVARLLLRGVKPEAILCVTYTKAAAAEMQRRLFERLGAWSVMSDEALTEQLSAEGEAPADLSRARVLFAKALETPGGLKIQTLHAFCEALLRRFPLEAGVAPGFNVLDDVQAAAVSARARDGLAELALARPDHAVALAYAHFAVELDLASFEALLKTFEIERRAITAYLDRCGGFEGAVADVWQACDFDAPTTVEAIEAEAVGACDWPAWREAVRALLASSAKTDLTLGAGMAALAEAEGDSFETIWGMFSTDKGEPRKSLGTKAIDPGIKAWLEGEQMRCHAAHLRLRAARVATDTVHALALAYAYAELYQGEKAVRGALDFPDLIGRAHALLTQADAAAWVLYKLDGGIDHVLLDEAQDTAPEQWAILEALTSEFFTGSGLPSERPLERTVFVVGDEKQSIYSFQGAQPEQFLEQTQAYDARATGAGRPFIGPRLVESWRSTPEVLGFVDAVFADPAARTALAPWSEEAVAHTARRPSGAGTVDLWPLEADAKSDPPDAWDPVDVDPPESARKRLARKVALEVKRIVREDAVIAKDRGPNGEEYPRPATPGDVLILVRKRDALFEEVIRALKAKDIAVPVAGADKLTLSDHIVFQDVLALVRFCQFPSDDLTLATLLRSPFCSVDEDSLFALAYGREGRSLWSVLKARADEQPVWVEARSFLGWARNEGRTRTPFTWLGRVLSYLDGQGRSVRQRILTRLGREAEDVLDELLAEALKAEGRGIYDLERFAAALERNEVQVKRELEAGGGEVRVMTVHGAKGLEAPIVILPEAAGGPQAVRGALLKTEAGGFLFAPRKADDCKASAEARTNEEERQAQEGLRLLYVALTRARDRVIVAGRLPGNRSVDKGPDPASWYTRVEAAFERPEIAPGVRMLGEVKRYGVDPWPAPAAMTVEIATMLPGWVHTRPSPEPASARYAAPSQLAEMERGPAPSPLATTRGIGRYRRGELIHKLLEVLPDLPPANRAEGARRLLDKARDLNAEQRAEMAAAALQVLDDPRFAEVFGPGSVAEAAIAGGAPDLPPDLRISGRIDRMVITPERILVVDFKTNRPAPAAIESADRSYVVQMAVYVAVLRALYPGRTVEAALVWTDGPRLMAVPENLIDQTLDGLRAEH
jgi:ATP-dependent helicase/nuclease subunit A